MKSSQIVVLFYLINNRYEKEEEVEDKYTCEICKNTYDLVNDESWNDKKAIDELHINFSDIDIDITPLSVVCDDCYNIIMKQ